LCCNSLMQVATGGCDEEGWSQSMGRRNWEMRLENPEKQRLG
jgi:hypothetical protein